MVMTLERPATSSQPRRADNHTWTTKEDDLMRAMYKRGAVRELASMFGVSQGVIYQRAKKLNLVKVLRRWTDDDDEQLAEYLGKYSLTKICKLTNRSFGSVRIRREKLNLKAEHVRNGWYTMSEVVDILRISKLTIMGAINAGRLKASYHYGGGNRQPPVAQNAGILKKATCGTISSITAAN